MVLTGKAKEPFRFCTRVNLLELTGIKAKDLEELLSSLKDVPGAVIYYHTHHFLQQHQYLSPEPPNDFAYWVTNVLQEDKLGEKLASINISEFNSIRGIREKIIEIIEKDPALTIRPLRIAPKGEEFIFKKSITFIFPTPYVARNLSEFVEILAKISINAIYFHVFEARLRSGKGVNDFSNWIAQSVGDDKLAHKIAIIDPYTYTLEGLRTTIIQKIRDSLVKDVIRGVEKGLDNTELR